MIHPSIVNVQYSDSSPKAPIAFSIIVFFMIYTVLGVAPSVAT